MQNFNTAELRPVEFARAYLQKKMLKKPLREDAGADVLRDSPMCRLRACAPECALTVHAWRVPPSHACLHIIYSPVVLRSRQTGAHATSGSSARDV